MTTKLHDGGRLLDPSLPESKKNTNINNVATQKRIGRWVILRWINIMKNTLHLQATALNHRGLNWNRITDFDDRIIWQSSILVVTHSSFKVHAGQEETRTRNYTLDDGFDTMKEGQGAFNFTDVVGQYIVSQSDDAGLLCLTNWSDEYFEREYITVKPDEPAFIPPLHGVKEHRVFGARGNCTAKTESGEIIDCPFDEFANLPHNEAVEINTDNEVAYLVRIWLPEDGLKPWERM